MPWRPAPPPGPPPSCRTPRAPRPAAPAPPPDPCRVNAMHSVTAIPVCFCCHWIKLPVKLSVTLVLRRLASSLSTCLLVTHDPCTEVLGAHRHCRVARRRHRGQLATQPGGVASCGIACCFCRAAGRLSITEMQGCSSNCYASLLLHLLTICRPRHNQREAGHKQQPTCAERASACAADSWPRSPAASSASVSRAADTVAAAACASFSSPCSSIVHLKDFGC